MPIATHRSHRRERKALSIVAQVVVASVALGALSGLGCVPAEKYAKLEQKQKRCAKRSRELTRALDVRLRELSRLFIKHERLVKRVRTDLKPTVSEIEQVRIQRRDEQRAEKLARRLRRKLGRFVRQTLLTVTEVEGLLVLETRGDVLASNAPTPELTADGRALLRQLTAVLTMLQPWPVHIRVQVPCVAKDEVAKAWSHSAGLAALLAQHLVSMGVDAYRVNAVALGPRRKALRAGPDRCDERVSIVLVPSSAPTAQLR